MKKPSLTPEEKINKVIKIMKERGERITVKNIIINSLFIAGGTPSEAEVKEYLKTI